MKKELLKTLETPCIVIDVKQAEENIKNMAKAVKCKLRPHIKTHKMLSFAKLQLDTACGISCAKITEAEVMSQVAKDIFIAYPLIGEVKINKALALQKKIDRLILAVDSLEGAKKLNDVAKKHNTIFEIRVEIDTGVKRTGISISKTLGLCKAVEQMSNLNLTGVYTFKSLVYKGTDTTDKYLAAKEEGEIMEKIAKTLRANGINIMDVSAGSTPTAIEVSKNKAITEVRPGTYVFYDYMMYKENSCKYEEIACRFYATVISSHEDYCVIDGGTKTFPMDIFLNQDPYNYTGYVYIDNNDLALTKMYEEHGIIYSKSKTMEYKVGDIIELVPIHICTAINLQNEVYLYKDGKLFKEKVAGRGMLT
ncbi:MAG: alanine racemase [Lachnospirales bacterium]